MDKSDALLYGFIFFTLITVLEFLGLGIWKIVEIYSLSQLWFWLSLAPIALTVVFFILALKFA